MNLTLKGELTFAIWELWMKCSDMTVYLDAYSVRYIEHFSISS